MKRKFLCFLYVATSICSVLSQERVPPVPLPPDPEEIYKVVEEMPRFPGCEHTSDTPREKERCAKEKMLEFIYANLVYPKEAEENGIEGMAVIQFNVWKDSTIRDIKIVRDPSAGTGQSAADVVAKMNDLNPKWRPGFRGGLPVCVQYTLPVKFKLEGEALKNRERQRKSVDNTIHTMDEVHEVPRFPHCKGYNHRACTQRSLKEFIDENLIYPEQALENGTEGKVKISFIIEPDGTLSTFKTSCSIPDGLCSEAIELFKWMNEEGMRWTPGKVQYRPVRTYYTVSVDFSIEDWNNRN